MLLLLLRNRARKGSLCRRVNRRVKSIQRSRRVLAEEHSGPGLIPLYHYLEHSYSIFPPSLFLSYRYTLTASAVATQRVTSLPQDHQQCFAAWTCPFCGLCLSSNERSDLPLRTSFASCLSGISIDALPLSFPQNSTAPPPKKKSLSITNPPTNPYPTLPQRNPILGASSIQPTVSCGNR